jgi:hypothetical protein
VTEESFGLNDAGKGIEVALSEDIIRKRHICTRASNRRRIVVYVVGDAEFEGYSIGLDSKSFNFLNFLPVKFPVLLWSTLWPLLMES